MPSNSFMVSTIGRGNPYIDSGGAISRKIDKGRHLHDLVRVCDIQ